MPGTDRRTWIEHLSPAVCWQLMASTPVGRVGVLHDGGPEIYPVNHVVDGHSIVFRTDPGGKLHALHRSPAVCFQVDAVDPATETGWSVLLKGTGTEVADQASLERFAQLDLRYWELGPKEHWVRIVPFEVTGRRLWAAPARTSVPGGGAG
ncbi:MAG TPA: pyridoxamine 5'-phosphate oxidase family protein [Acidimicrobiales bacterium]|nr:pyridoxamine 5'-phosphate oxidase family protein [Acidimicrobiales bacterium]